MMYIDNEVLEKMIMTIVEGFDRIEKKLDRMGRVKEFLNGDELLDNYDIARLLNVSLRTVARYREKGLIRYTRRMRTARISTGVRIYRIFCRNGERKTERGNVDMRKLC